MAFTNKFELQLICGDYLVKVRKCMKFCTICFEILLLSCKSCTCTYAWKCVCVQSCLRVFVRGSSFCLIDILCDFINTKTYLFLFEQSKQACVRTLSACMLCRHCGRVISLDYTLQILIPLQWLHKYYVAATCYVTCHSTQILTFTNKLYWVITR